MAITKTVNLFPAGALTATTNGVSVSPVISSKPINNRSDGVNRHMLVMVDVTAVTGTTPTLDPKVQGQFVAGGNWVDLQPALGTTNTAWTQITATGQQARRYEGPLPLEIRGVATIGGTTPSFTFTMTAQLGG